MKKFLIAFSFLCVGVTMSAEASELVITPKNWFKVTTVDSESYGGTVTADSPAKWEKIEGNTKFKVASDLDNRVNFEATSSLSDTDPYRDKLANVTLNLEAAIVPTGFLDNLTANDKVAFALYNDATAGKVFKAWLSDSWTTLTGTTVPTEGTAYTLLMEFDNREADKKVRFTITVGSTTTVLKDTGNAEWLTYATTGITKNVDFIGNGNVVDFMGEKLEIIAEIVEVDGGKIKINEDDMDRFRATMPDGYLGTVDNFIAGTAQDAFGSDKFKTANVSVGAAYVLGLVDVDNTKMAPVAEGVLKATPFAESGLSTGVKLNMNVTYNSERVAYTGATVVYQVVDGTGPATPLSDFVIPKAKLAEGLKVFRVQAVVTPAAK